MVARKKKNASQPRVADEIMAGMRELQRMMEKGKRPEEMFRVRRVTIANSKVRRTRLSGDGPKRS